jgi:hypothetical protein
MNGTGATVGQPYDRYFDTVSRILRDDIGIDLQDYNINIDQWRNFNAAIGQKGIKSLCRSKMSLS